MAAVSAAQDVGADVHSTECMLDFGNRDSPTPVLKSCRVEV